MLKGYQWHVNDTTLCVYLSAFKVNLMLRKHRFDVYYYWKDSWNRLEAKQMETKNISKRNEVHGSMKMDKWSVLHYLKCCNSEYRVLVTIQIQNKIKNAKTTVHFVSPSFFLWFHVNMTCLDRFSLLLFFLFHSVCEMLLVQNHRTRHIAFIRHISTYV